jgi:hypothetical protein
VTVRAWFTISAIVVAALIVAVAVRFFVPGSSGPPEIVARVGDVRLDGELLRFCWPQRDGEVRCEQHFGDDGEARTTIPPSGRMRIFVQYPVQPKRGSILIYSGRGVDLRHKWTNDLRYSLRPGRYTLTVEVSYDPAEHSATRPEIAYEFPVMVTRSGS